MKKNTIFIRHRGNSLMRIFTAAIGVALLATAGSVTAAGRPTHSIRPGRFVSWCRSFPAASPTSSDAQSPASSNRWASR
jgi:hypothetical protein